AEALWQSFRRQGKRVGVLACPGCDHSSPARSADFGMVRLDAPLAAADEIVLYGADFTPPVASGAGRGEAPPRACRLPVTLGVGRDAARVEFSVTALARTADPRPGWDTLRFDTDDSVANGVLAEVRAGEWFPLRADLPHPDGGRRVVGAWCLLQRLDPDLAEVRIYRGAFHATNAYPRAFRESLDARVGFWPGPPDERALAAHRRGAGGLEPGQILEQARRFSDFLTAATRLALAEQGPDLLIACQPIVDEMERAFLIVDPRQSAFSPARVAQAAELRGEAWRSADRAVGEIARGLDLDRDAFFVVSDHGMMPVWQEIRINQILVDAGLTRAERGERGWQVQADSRMVAFASGGCAHLVVNQAGREAGGVVAAGDAAAVVRRAALQLSRVQVDGESVVEAMFSRDEL
ncbi:MAG: alkaline phosphatase family protein, partial [Acidobacteria bacterium]|nr:alkaline phosphatase family protein [Acidobacteriota bacterium]